MKSLKEKHINVFAVIGLICILVLWLIKFSDGRSVNHIDVNTVYKISMIGDDGHVTDSYWYLELLDNGTYVKYTDQALMPDPKSQLDNLYEPDSTDGEYDSYAFCPIEISVGNYTVSGEEYNLDYKDDAIAMYTSHDQWVNRKPDDYMEGIHLEKKNAILSVTKDKQCYYYIEEYGDYQIKYLFSSEENKSIPQSIEEFKQEYAKNY